MAPGTTATERVLKVRTAEETQRVAEAIPVRRLGEPEEVAQAYLYLMRGGYTTGQVLHVDGGGSVV